MRTFVFLDLDDTLFQSRSKCPTEPSLEPAAYLRDGSVCSYTTDRQRQLLALARQAGAVIPTTARNLDAFSRVAIPFADGAILDFGGVILERTGRPDPEWASRMASTLAGAARELDALCSDVQSFAVTHNQPLRAWVVRDFGQNFYLTVKANDPSRLDSLEHCRTELITPWLRSSTHRFVCHQNCNNIAVTPAQLDKAHAVSYLIGKLRNSHGSIMTLGIGDSDSDAPFLACCDFALLPSTSQLARRIGLRQ